MKKAATFFVLTALLCALYIALASAADVNAEAKPKGPYTLEEAELLIYERIPGASIAYFRQDYDDGYQVYEGQATDEQYAYKFEIDPQTGMFLEWDMDLIRQRAQATIQPDASAPGAPSELIGTARAREIALAQAGENAVILRIKLDREDGRQVYEGKGYSALFEFEFEIDAMTGAILDWEWED